MIQEEEKSLWFRKGGNSFLSRNKENLWKTSCGHSVFFIWILLIENSKLLRTVTYMTNSMVNMFVCIYQKEYLWNCYLFLVHVILIWLTDHLSKSCLICFWPSGNRYKSSILKIFITFLMFFIYLICQIFCSTLFSVQSIFFPRMIFLLRLPSSRLGCLIHLERKWEMPCSLAWLLAFVL